MSDDIDHWQEALDNDYDEDDGNPYCICSALHSDEELDFNICDTCGKIIKD